MLGGMICTAIVVGTGITPSSADTFKNRFMDQCRASDGDGISTCTCRYNRLVKPRNANEEALVLQVLRKDDAKVEASIRTIGGLRPITIINSMTIGLSCR